MSEETSEIIIGIDVGTRRVGVAVSDEGRTFALPHDTLDASHAPLRVVALARERRANLIVIGWPLDLEGREGRATRNVERFIERLENVAEKEEYPLTIETYDERLTTGAAEHLLGEANIFGKKRKSVIDQVAATQILQNYLDENR